MIIKIELVEIMNLIKSNIVKIEHNGKLYNIDKDKLKYVFNKLNIEIDVDNIENIKRKFIKFDLFDDRFLENLNKIW